METAVSLPRPANTAVQPATRRAEWVVTAALVAFMLVLFYRTSPALVPYPHRDSGIFMYAGQQITRGETLYVDMWDHKPPLIFWFNALGFVIGGGSTWGVWLLEAAFMLGAVLLSIRTLRAAFGFSAAAFGTFAWLVASIPLIVGNQTEEYALLFQFGALYAFIRLMDGRRRLLYSALVGVCVALAFLMRQNLIGVGAAIGAYIAARGVLEGELRESIRRLLAMGAGFAAVLVVTLGLFLFNGTFSAMWQAAFTYNFIYSSSTLPEKALAMFGGLLWTVDSGVPFIAMAAWVAGLILWAGARKRLRDLHPLLAVALIAFPVELLLASLSGRRYEHYYTAWLPVYGLLCAYFASGITSALQALPRQVRQIPSANIVLGVMACAVALFPTLTILRELPQDIASAEQNRRILERVTGFIDTTSTPDDSVLVWGGAPAINVMIDRRAPSRFYVSYPLFRPAFQNAALFEGFLDELRADPPLYIVDTSQIDRRIPPLDPAGRVQWLFDKERGIRAHDDWKDFHVPPEMNVIFDYVAANYTRVTDLAGGWALYQRLE